MRLSRNKGGGKRREARAVGRRYGLETAIEVTWFAAGS